MPDEKTSIPLDHRLSHHGVAAIRDSPSFLQDASRGAERKQEDTMKCHRCRSEMVYQKFFGPHEHFWGWRCIFCGEIIDQVILENRTFPGARAALNRRTRRR